VDRFNLRKLSELEVRKHYQIKKSNRSTALENFSGNEDINRAWENFEENIKTSAKDSLGPYELCDVKRHFGLSNAFFNIPHRFRSLVSKPRPAATSVNFICIYIKYSTMIWAVKYSTYCYFLPLPAHKPADNNGCVS